jgi:hypothetical protein
LLSLTANHRSNLEDIKPERGKTEKKKPEEMREN